jgi:hypothetical protein
MKHERLGIKLDVLVFGGSSVHKMMQVWVAIERPILRTWPRW